MVSSSISGVLRSWSRRASASANAASYSSVFALSASLDRSSADRRDSSSDVNSWMRAWASSLDVSSSAPSSVSSTIGSGVVVSSQGLSRVVSISEMDSSRPIPFAFDGVAAENSLVGVPDASKSRRSLSLSEMTNSSCSDFSDKSRCASLRLARVRSNSAVISSMEVDNASDPLLPVGLEKVVPAVVFSFPLSAMITACASFPPFTNNSNISDGNLFSSTDSTLPLLLEILNNSPAKATTWFLNALTALE
mmetsp:Transcript_1611/g.3045  ORF Transcript_1611/g.3045 Transcript_1611/m.3045 type:complete len:250 (-) Transcript_1611:1420-2169(-)